MKHATVALAIAALAFSTSGAEASSPGSSKVAVPKAGPVKTKPVTWTGTVPVGAAILDPVGLTCSAQPAAQMYDSHDVKVTVPAGAYSVVKATMVITVQSSMGLLNGDFMEVLDPSGASYGMDRQKGEMVVEVPSPVSGTYKVLVCTFVPDDEPDHAYTGSVMIKTKCRAASPCPATPKKKR